MSAFPVRPAPLEVNYGERYANPNVKRKNVC